MPKPKREKSAVEQKRAWKLRLYVVNGTPRCLQAFANLKRICEQHVGQRYEITVIDVLTRADLLRNENILAVPTVVRTFPEPKRRIIGDLSKTAQVVAALGLPEPAGQER